MNLRDIAAVSGKSGLYRVLKPTRTGVILESLDANKTKLVANANSRVSILKEISVYTTTAEGTVMLEDVYAKVYAQFKLELPVNSKSNESELRNFIEGIVPEYDKDRVYASDIKKMVTWYGIISSYYPEVFELESVEGEKGAALIATENAASTSGVAVASDAGSGSKAKSQSSVSRKPTNTPSKRGA